MSSERAKPLLGCGAWLGFGAGSVLAGVLAGLLGMIWLSVTTGSATAADPMDLQALGPGYQGFVAVIQSGGFLGIAILLAWLLPLDDLRAVPRLKRVFAVNLPHPIWWPAALIGGLLVGFPGGQIAEQMLDLPIMEAVGAVALMHALTDLLSDVWAPGYPLLMFAVILWAPLTEELVFRGFLWHTARKALPAVGVLLAVSVLFALIHFNPIHIAGVFLTGLFFTALRWASGSVWPGMLAHFTNNLLAMAMVIWLPETGTPMWLTGLGLLLPFALLVAAHLATRPKPATDAP